MPLNILNQYSKLAKILKLKYVKFDIPCNCLNKIFQHNLSINNTNILEDVTAFAIVGINKILFCVLNKGVNDFSITTNFDDNYAEIAAESHMDYINGEVSDYDNFVVKWLDEISKYIRYYNSIDYELKINKLYIYGSANLEDNLLQHLTGILNIEVAVLNSISNIELINKEVEKGFNIKIFLTPLLAAFNDKNDIYFQCEKNNMLSTRRIDFLVVVILLLLIAVFNYIIYLKSNEINNKKLFVSDKDNVLLNNEIEILKKDITYLENMARNIQILKETSNNDDFVRSEIFREIKYAIPQSTQVTSISVDRYSTQLNCNSYSMEEVTLFLEKLRKIGFIESVYIPSMEIKEELNYSYSVVCVLKEVLFIDK
jgi:Tfp pilus assembly protein PilN